MPSKLDGVWKRPGGVHRCYFPCLPLRSPAQLEHLVVGLGCRCEVKLVADVALYPKGSPCWTTGGDIDFETVLHTAYISEKRAAFCSL